MTLKKAGEAARAALNGLAQMAKGSGGRSRGQAEGRGGAEAEANDGAFAVVPPLLLVLAPHKVASLWRDPRLKGAGGGTREGRDPAGGRWAREGVSSEGLHSGVPRRCALIIAFRGRCWPRPMICAFLLC